MFRTLDGIGSGRRILLRLDLNSPVDNGVVQDNKRFDRHANTVRELIDADHRIAILAHQGRPGRKSFVSLDGHAELLSRHLDHPVEFVDDVYGDRAIERIERLDPGSTLLLENVRTVADELADRTPSQHARSEFVRSLAPSFDAFVNDAYSTAHRTHASTVGFPLVLDAYGGRVMEAEYVANTAIQSRSFDGCVTMILGGKKVDDLMVVLDRVEDKVDTVCLGGVIAELFLRGEGYEVGFDVEDTSLYDRAWRKNGDAIRKILAEEPFEIQLPVDLAYLEGETRIESAVEDIEKTRPLLDIGESTIQRYSSEIADSAGIFLKGALGKFEDERFSHGTVGILRSIAESNAFSVIGGGDTAWAIDRYGLDESAYSHVSIAGGAYVRALAGESLPAIEALIRSAERT